MKKQRQLPGCAHASRAMEKCLIHADKNVSSREPINFTERKGKGRIEAV
jgi:hypothetical protein